MTKWMQENITGAILLGGEGKRMGNINKSQLKKGEETFFEVTLAALGGFSQVVLSARRSTSAIPEGFPVVYDEAAAGPMGGIVALLRHCTTPYVFVLSCDMPYIQKELVTLLLSKAKEGVQGVFPLYQGKIEPLCGLYHKSLLPVLEEYIGQGRFGLRYALSSCAIKEVPVTDTPYAHMLYNVNFPREYEKVQEGFGNKC